MNKPIKFFALFISLSLFVASLSFNTLAAENTQEAEQTPYLYGVYYNENNDEVDGNTLTSGEYTVDIMLEGVEGVSVLQYTAEYDPSVVTSISTDAVITDSKSDISLGGIKTADAENGKKRVAVALASTASRYTSLDADAATPVTQMSVTVDAGDGTVDFEDYFDFVTDPDLTFLEDDYNNGIEDVYALDMSVPTAYNKTLMTADITPENELEPDVITVSGKILIAGDAQGTATSFGLRGVTIYAYDNDNQVIASTVSNSDGDKSTWGDYSLEVPAGTTNFMVGDPSAKDTIVNRPFTVSGDADVTGADVPVVMCDYNDDGGVNVVDDAAFGKLLKGGYNIYGDFNNDGGVNVVDDAAFGKILKNGNLIVYSESLFFD